MPRCCARCCGGSVPRVYPKHSRLRPRWRTAASFCMIASDRTASAFQHTKIIMSGGKCIRCEKPKKQKGDTTAPERFLALYTRKTSSTRPRLSACVDRKARSITYLRNAKGKQDRKFLALNTAYIFAS